jgi:hypothetical protein
MPGIQSPLVSWFEAVLIAVGAIVGIAAGRRLFGIARREDDDTSPPPPPYIDIS